MKFKEIIAWSLFIGAGYCVIRGAIQFVSFDETGLGPEYYGEWIGGVVGVWFALAGVCLFASALFMQSQELTNQIKEMKLQRIANENSAREIHEQNKLIQLQMNLQTVQSQVQMDIALLNATISADSAPLQYIKRVENTVEKFEKYFGEYLETLHKINPEILMP